MCAFRYVRVATIDMRAWLFRRAAYKGARFSSEFRLAHCTELCRFLALASSLSLPLLCVGSRLCSALVSHLLSSLFCSSLCCGLLALCSAFDSILHSTLLGIRLYSAFASTPRFGSASVSALGAVSLVAWPSTHLLVHYCTLLLE